MTRNYSARAYEWRDGDKNGEPGAMLSARRRHAFIPAHKLRWFADKLHDIADSYEQKKTR